MAIRFIHVFSLIRARPVCPRLHSSSFDSPRRAPGIVGFIRVLSVHSGAPRVSSGRARSSGAPRGSSSSFAFVSFVLARPGGRLFHSRSFSAPTELSSGMFGSFEHATWVVGFIPVCLVHLGAPRCSSSLFGLYWLIRARPGCRRVHSGSLVHFRAPRMWSG